MALPKTPEKLLPILAGRVGARVQDVRGAEAARDNAMRAAAKTHSIREIAALTGLSTARVQQILTPDQEPMRRARAAKRTPKRKAHA